MTVEDVFTIQGRGVVAVGRVEAGVLNVGDKVQISGQSGARKTAVVAGLEAFRKRLAKAGAGDNVGILLRDVTKADVRRGDLLTGTDIEDFSWKP
jgi:elongation factor Tu